MKPDDPAITWIEEPKLGIAGKMYLAAVLAGVGGGEPPLVQRQGDHRGTKARPVIGNPLGGELAACIA